MGLCGRVRCRGDTAFRARVRYRGDTAFPVGEVRGNTRLHTNEGKQNLSDSQDPPQAVLYFHTYWSSIIYDPNAAQPMGTEVFS